MYDETRVRDGDAKSILECIQCMVGWLVGSEGEEELSVGLEQMQRLLPSSEQPQADVQRCAVSPMMICDVFKQVLNAEHVAVGSGFFGMGGDSILAIRAVGCGSEKWD